jgi:signal transduction histidine kinase
MASAPHATGLPDGVGIAAPAPGVNRGRWERFIPAVLRDQGDDFDRTTTERTRRTWAGDIAAAVISVLIAFAIDFGDGGHHPSTQLILDAVFVPIVVVLLFWRRQRPLQVLIAAAVINCISPGVGFAALIATFAVAAYSRPTIGAVGIGIALVSVPIATTVWPHASGDDGTFWSNLIFGVIITAGVGAWGLFSGARRELMATLRERATRAETEQALRVDQARAQERTRIAREMHDVLAHRMSLLSVHAGALEYRPDAPPEDVARAAGVIRATAHEALEELRTVIGVLRVGDALLPGAAADGDRPLAPEPPQPTLTAVQHLVDEWRDAGARIELDLGGVPLDDVPVTIGRTAYRIIQEGLTNAGKHAATAKVEVVVTGTRGESLHVSVTNPLSVGLAEPAAAAQIPGTGLGLVGLRERTELVGGAFAAGIDEDLRRFVIEARLPWAA